MSSELIKIGKKRKSEDHRGLSLIEVIVTILIAAFAILGITMLMSVGTNTYRLTNVETQLQKESQIAINQMDDILIKASYYQYFEDMKVNESMAPTLVCLGSEANGSVTEEYYYAIVFDKSNQKLYFTKEEKIRVASVDNWAERMAKEQIESATPSLLANYVSSLEVEPKSSAINLEGIVHITLNLELSGKNFATFSTISFRNQ